MIWNDLLIVSVRAIDKPTKWRTEIRAKKLDGETVIIKVINCQPKFWSEIESYDGEHEASSSLGGCAGFGGRF